MILGGKLTLGLAGALIAVSAFSYVRISGLQAKVDSADSKYAILEKSYNDSVALSQGLGDRIKEQNESIQKLVTASRKYEELMEQLPDRLSTIRRQTSADIQRILSSTVPLQCEDAAKWARDNSNVQAERFNSGASR